jgi:hypothetical protein
VSRYDKIHDVCAVDKLEVVDYLLPVVGEASIDDNNSLPRSRPQEIAVAQHDGIPTTALVADREKIDFVTHSI